MFGHFGQISHDMSQKSFSFILSNGCMNFARTGSNKCSWGISGREDPHNVLTEPTL